MGNSATHGRSGTVILSNGAVFKYDQPLTVAELMLEHPQEVVVELHSVTNGTKPTPMPADKNLDMKRLYLMLPFKQGKPAKLSSQEAQQLLIKVSSLLKSKALLSYTGFIPLFVRICPSAHEPLMDTKRKLSVEKKDKDDYFSAIFEGRPEFLSRQKSGKGWKPSLDTIKEKAIKAKAHHWLF